MYDVSLLNMNIYLSFFPDERELCIFITTGCNKKGVLDLYNTSSEKGLSIIYL